MNIPSIFRITILLSAVALPAVGQQFGPGADNDGAGLPASSSVVSTSTTDADTIPVWQKHFDRFVDLMDFALRYRAVADSNGAHEYNQDQNRTIVDGKFKFDAKGKYGVVFHASTGHYFNWSYADFMGGGTKQAKQIEALKQSPTTQFVLGFVSQADGKDVLAAENSGGWAMYIRRLYLDIEPVKGVEAQYGSLDINRGESSEITTYDNDGWISGEPLVIRRPHHFFPTKPPSPTPSSETSTSPSSSGAPAISGNLTTTSSCSAKKHSTASTPPSTTPGRSRRTPSARARSSTRRGPASFTAFVSRLTSATTQLPGAASRSEPWSAATATPSPPTRRLAVASPWKPAWPTSTSTPSSSPKPPLPASTASALTEISMASANASSPAPPSS